MFRSLHDRLFSLQGVLRDESGRGQACGSKQAIGEIAGAIPNDAKIMAWEASPREKPAESINR